MKIGRLEIQYGLRFTWHKAKKKSIYSGIICDICGQRIHHVQDKGTHIIKAHPEYQIKRIHVNTKDRGYLKGSYHEGYLAYECSFCGYRITGPAFMVRHIQEEHAEQLKHKEGI